MKVKKNSKNISSAMQVKTINPIEKPTVTRDTNLMNRFTSKQERKDRYSKDEKAEKVKTSDAVVEK